MKSPGHVARNLTQQQPGQCRHKSVGLHRTANMFRGTYSLTSRAGQPPKNSNACTCDSVQARWSIRITGRTNRCREYRSTIENAHTRRRRPARGSGQVPR